MALPLIARVHIAKHHSGARCAAATAAARRDERNRALTAGPRRFLRDLLAHCKAVDALVDEGIGDSKGTFCFVQDVLKKGDVDGEVSGVCKVWW